MADNEHEPITDEQLTQIKQRADNATPGPWKALGGSIVTVDEEAEVADWISHNDADVLFIATSRHTIPALVTEVERLRTDNDLLEATAAGTESYCDRLRAENAAMRPIVEAVATMKAAPGNSYCAACAGMRVRTYDTKRHTQRISDDYEHTPDCPVKQARTYLTEHPVAFVAAHPTKES